MTKAEPRGRPKRSSKVPPPKKLPAPGLVQQGQQGETYQCICCGERYDTPRKNFPSTYSRLFVGWDGYFPVCKGCVGKYYEWLTSDVYGGNEKEAMRHLCQLLDWCFDDEVFSRAKSSLTTRNLKKTVVDPYALVGEYNTKMTTSYIRYNGLTYVDTSLREKEESRQSAIEHDETQQSMIEDASKDGYERGYAQAREEFLAEIYSLKTQLADAYAGIVPEEPVDLSCGIPSEIIHRFGAGFTDEEYEYLQAQYEDWTECYACDTKIQEELFKNICLAQLNINKAQHSEGGDIARATKAFNDLVLMANIAPKQQKNLLSEADTFGTLIERWEKEEPIPEPEPEWADVDGIKRYISTWFFGHLCKMFKIENDWAQMYEDELTPYTAHPPVYQGDFDLSEDGDANGDQNTEL